jgi:DNA-binding NtrC family response regulator
VRELANACAFAVHVGEARGRVDLEHWPETPVLPGAGAGPVAPGLHAETRALEERRLREALQRTRGNKSQAARALGLSRQGLLKKLRRYGFTRAESAALALDGAGGAP